jgi:ABC-2 type transport system permease protein
MFRRIFSMLIKEIIQLRRDWLFVLVILLGPVSELSAVAYATGVDIKNLPLGICDHDRSALSRDLIQTLANVETFDLVNADVQPDDIKAMLDKGDVYAMVVIPPDFGANILNATARPPVQVLLNGAESRAAQTAMQSIDGALAKYSIDLVLEDASVENLEPSARVWYNEELSEANYTIPSELGFMLYMVAVMIASVGFAREHELGTMEQLLVMPISKFEMIVGKSIPAVVIAYTNFLLMLSMTVFLFGVPMRGSLGLLLGLAFFYILVELQRGLLISLMSRTQQQALMIVFLMCFIDMTFSGYAVPVESMPKVFQIVAYIFPIRHWMIIMRGIMLKGVGLEVFWPHVVAIVILGLGLTGVSLLSFRRALGE